MPPKDTIETQYVGPEVRKDGSSSIVDRYLSSIAQLVRELVLELEARVQVPVQDSIFLFQF